MIGALLGCVGAIRERAKLIWIYCCILFLAVMLQIGFGAAAGAVASGWNPATLHSTAFIGIRTRAQSLSPPLSISRPPLSFSR